MTVRDVRAPGWARLLFTDSLSAHAEAGDKPALWGWIPVLALITGVTVVVASIAAEANRRGYEHANFIFYLSVSTFMIPIAARVVLLEVSRFERISALLLATLALFVLRYIHEPASFVDHDAFLHWATASDILDTSRLFQPNPLLPISAVYPGLEIAATALVSLSGLSVFVAAQLIMVTVRLVFVAALYLVYERITGSSRIAAVATVLYMGASSFVFFDTMFSYGGLALTFLTLTLLVDLRAEQSDSWRVIFCLGFPIVGALALTHHLTAFITLLLLAAFAGLSALRRDWSASVRTSVLAAATLTCTLGWSMVVGNPSEGYLGPVFENAIEEAARFVSFDGGRIPFVAEDGTMAPLWQRVITLSSVLVICFGLLTSFFRSLAHAGVPLALRELPSRWRSVIDWRNSRLVVLTLMTFAYPLSILLRMTRAGWEVGNRIGPFTFLGVGVVIAIGVVTYWHGTSASRARATVFGVIAAMSILAGIISGSGNYVLGSDKYRVSADSASVEPMAISAASWTNAWLGPRNRFFSDRTNRLLLATYGRQEVITTLYDGYDLADVLLAPAIRRAELQAMRETDVDYFLIDMRITQQLPLIGWYFDPGPVYDEPPDPEVLLKFNTLVGVSRVFDNGYISIADIRPFRDHRHE